MKKIFENSLIEVTEAENGSYSFITIDNKTNGQICVHYDKPGYNDNYDPIVINPNRQVILLTEEENKDWIEAFKRNQIYIVTDDDEIENNPTGCSMTQWNEDCKNITATDPNPSDVDWIIDSNEDEYDEDGNLILDHKAAFNFQVGDVIIIGFLDDFGDISRAEKFKVIKNDHKHLVCESIL